MDSSASHKHSRARDEEERSGGVAYDHLSGGHSGMSSARFLVHYLHGAFQATLPHSMFITHVQARFHVKIADIQAYTK